MRERRWHMLGVTALLAGASLGAQGSLPMGTTRGEKATRLVIQNAMIISGRGTPGTNRATPPEGPVDIVIEGNRIVDIVLLDPVNTSGRSGDFRPRGDRMLDAKGMICLAITGACSEPRRTSARRAPRWRGGSRTGPAGHPRTADP